MNTVRGRMVSLLLLFALTLLVVPVAFAKEVAIHVAKDATLGDILVDSDGNSLYRFTKDTVNVSSACYGGCAVAWPPLLIDDGSNPVASAGVDGKLLGVLTRTDGKRQVMYNGMPLYYYQKDTKRGDVVGQNVGKVWFIVHPNTTTVGNQAVALKSAQSAALGAYLTDSAGRTLYLFAKDSENHSVCYGGCATNWPPLLVGATEATLDGIGGTLGVTMRDDGNHQVTYGGKPLYYWFKDAKPGDTTGQGVGNVWFVLAPVALASAPASSSALTSPSTPATLPRTGESGGAPIGAIALLALLIVALGAVVRFRYYARGV